MSFLNKFKKEFEGLNLGERLQEQQQATQGGAVNNQGYSAPPQTYGYDQQSQTNNPYPNQYHGAEGTHYGAQHNKWPAGSQTSFEYGYQNQGQQPMQGQGGLGYNPTQHLQQQLSPPTSPPTHTTYHHSPQNPASSPSPSGGSYGHPSSGPPVPYTGGSHGSSAPGPTPPRWIPYWSGADRRWYYVETTGRSAWEPPANSQPLPTMPEYLGVNAQRGNEGQGPYGTHQAITRVNSQMSLPGAGNEEKKSSSHTALAAAGGFVAGGVAGYFIHDTLDKRKKKKRHGRTPADFADFQSYPAMELNLTCNICDQTIFGPYAHCTKCDGGDYDICRDCLAQGASCEGRGKHRLIKVYPKYFCNGCDQLIRGDFYHCSICKKGDWDICQSCLDRGRTCKANGGHQMAKLYIPPPNFGKHSGGSDSSSSSSDSD